MDKWKSIGIENAEVIRELESAGFDPENAIFARFLKWEFYPPSNCWPGGPYFWGSMLDQKVASVEETIQAFSEFQQKNESGK